MQRRDFLRVSALGAAAVAAPTSLVHAASTPAPAAKSANGKVNLGFIGLGQQAMFLLSTFMAFDDVRVLAGCDVYDIKRNRFERRVKEY